ncbi:hypothetical protein LUZ61_006941 [Rhynchospora tenuis]|uniref:Pentatricopeptide repeat-containing protein n=1 Tax=Rhynchospora tenuis TaxID=198213 RepID=A0AAD5ZSJ3_9POAL|nr:hypothetical protein LUZ61_006941 [Rhynchospora tenuis]
MPDLTSSLHNHYTSPSPRHTPNPRKQVWLKSDRHHNYHSKPQYADRSVHMPSLLASLSLTTSFSQLTSVMSRFVASGGYPVLSLRFMCSLLSSPPFSSSPSRSLALLDWMYNNNTSPTSSSSSSLYPPSLHPYNLVLRTLCRCDKFDLACGLLMEMRSLALRPDAISYSTVISSLCSAGHLDLALSCLPLMEEDRVRPDLVLYSTLMHLSLKLGDPSKAISLFSRMCASGVTPDLRAFNGAISAYCSAGLMKDALRVLTNDMAGSGVAPDATSYSTLLSAFVKRGRFLAALSLFSQMQSSKVRPDLTTFNIVLHAYGQAGLAREADRLFWSMSPLGVNPSVVTYNTMLRVYGDAELFGEAIHLFRLMQKKEIEQNVVTYNTMIAIYGKSLEHEKASNLVQEMQMKGIQPNAITYSTIISIWGKAGKLDRAAKLFQKLRESGVEIDPVLYQTMIVVYERAGLVAHARRLLHDLKHPENMPKDTAIKILANAGRVEEAAWVFRQAVKEGEVKELSVYGSMIELFSRNRRHNNVVEVFDDMRERGFFPDSETIATVLNAYGKLREFDKASALYREMEEERCVFTDRVHFQMLSLLGMKGDFDEVDRLIDKLGKDPEIDKKELRLVAASVYERANRLDEAFHIYDQIRNSGCVDTLEGS